MFQSDIRSSYDVFEIEENGGSRIPNRIVGLRDASRVAVDPVSRTAKHDVVARVHARPLGIRVPQLPNRRRRLDGRQDLIAVRRVPVLGHACV